MIKVYSKNTEIFITNGLGNIEPISCIENKKKNIDGWTIDVVVQSKYDYLIKEDNIITCETKEKGSQPFRIKNIKKNNRQISFTAKHIYYDLENYILDDVRPVNKGPIEYLEWCKDRADSNMSNWTVTGDAIGTATHYFIRKNMLQVIEQMLIDFDCMVDFDVFNIRIMKTLGTDSKLKLAYGKNIEGVSIEENWDDVCTKILPVGPNGIQLPEVYLINENKIDSYHKYTKIVEFSNIKIQEEDGTAIADETIYDEIRKKSKEYLEEHSEPNISYSIKADTPQNLNINDSVIVAHPLVDLKANVQQYTYNVNTKKVKSIIFGNYDTSPKAAFEQSISAVSKLEAEKVTNNNLTRFNQDMIRLNETIANAFGLYLIKEIAPNGSTKFYMGDHKTIAESKTLWTINSGAFAVSTDGGNTWNSGISADGTIIAHYLSTIGIQFDWAKGGTLELGGSTNGSGELVTYADDGTEILRINNKGLMLKISEKSTTLANALTGLNNDINRIQEQLDGEMKSYVGTEKPTQLNYPAIDWDTESKKQSHIGTYYYDNENCKSYRWTFTGFLTNKGVVLLNKGIPLVHYYWLEIKDSEVSKAIADAAEALKEIVDLTQTISTSYWTSKEVSSAITTEIGKFKSEVLSDYVTTVYLNNEFEAKFEKKIATEISQGEDKISTAVNAVVNKSIDNIAVGSENIIINSKDLLGHKIINAYFTNNNKFLTCKGKYLFI